MRKCGSIDEILLQSAAKSAADWWDQAKKSVGRMPWHQEPKKDVTSCESCGKAHIAGEPQISEWGNPAGKSPVTIA